MKMQSAVDEYLVEIEVRKYTPKTIRSYRCNLNLFLRFCAEKLHVETVAALTPAVVRQFSRCMSEAGRKGTYINGVLKSIKSFIQYCYEEGYGGFDTRKTFKWCKEEKPVITAFSPEQVRIMLQSCRGHDYLSLRDYAILTLLFETGIRCWELCCIREEDMLRISAMNLMLHSISNPEIDYKDSVSKQNQISDRFTMCLANPPFKGTINAESIDYGGILPIGIINRVFRPALLTIKHGKIISMDIRTIIFTGYRTITKQILLLTTDDISWEIPSGAFICLFYQTVDVAV